MNDADLLRTLLDTAHRCAELPRTLTRPGVDGLTPLQRNRDRHAGAPRSPRYGAAPAGGTPRTPPDPDAEDAGRALHSDPTGDAAIRPDPDGASRAEVDRLAQLASGAISAIAREIARWPTAVPAPTRPACACCGTLDVSTAGLCRSCADFVHRQGRRPTRLELARKANGVGAGRLVAAR